MNARDPQTVPGSAVCGWKGRGVWESPACQTPQWQEGTCGAVTEGRALTRLFRSMRRLGAPLFVVLTPRLAPWGALWVSPFSRGACVASMASGAVSLQACPRAAPRVAAGLGSGEAALSCVRRVLEGSLGRGVPSPRTFPSICRACLASGWRMGRV